MAVIEHGPPTDYLRGIAAYDAGRTPYWCEHADCKDRALVGLCQSCYAAMRDERQRPITGDVET